MNKNQKKYLWIRCLIVACLLFSFEQTIFSLVVGSETVPSVQLFVSFPASDTDNTMLGFAAFESGFGLEDNTTGCTFDSFFPIAGDVFLRGGDLFLKKDLIFDNKLNFTGGGTIWGDFFAICLPKASVEFDFPGTSATDTTPLSFNSTIIVLNSSVAANMEWQFTNTCKIRGRGNKLRLKNGTFLTVRDGAHLILEDVILTDVGDNNLRCLTDNASIKIKNSKLVLGRNYTFSRGAILFDCDVIISGTNKWIHAASRTSTIAAKSVVLIDRGMTFSYDPGVANKNLIYFEDETSTLYLDNCTLHATHTGIKFSTGRLIFDNRVTLSSEARTLGEAIEFDSTLGIHVLSGSLLDVFGYVLSV